MPRLILPEGCITCLTACDLLIEFPLLWLICGATCLAEFCD
jgi:hypothetical protein